jgi:type-F conjugative transfer system pilin assembly protein TrbC
MDRLRGAIGKQKDSSAATGPQLAPSPSQAERRRAFEAIRKRASSFQMEARARDALHAGEEKRAAEHDAMAKRLRQALGLEAPEMEAIARVAAPPAYKAWVPVLFVSSSIPLATLRAYAAQLERVSGVLALRGMPGGLAKVAPMAKLAAEILRLDPGCQGPACAMRNVQLIVDPMVFRQHGITRVPALGMIPGDPTQPYCERDDESPRAGHIVYGDAALSGLLDEYARLGGNREVADAQARLGNR